MRDDAEPTRNAGAPDVRSPHGAWEREFRGSVGTRILSFPGLLLPQR
jgi:hypothetical protein